MVGSDTDPALVTCHIIYTVRDALPVCQDREIVCFDLLGPPFWLILESTVGKMSYQFFLFCVY